MSSPAEIAAARQAFMTDVTMSIRQMLGILIRETNNRIETSKQMEVESLILPVLGIVQTEIPKQTSFTFIAKLVADHVKTKGRELQQEITDQASLRQRQLTSSQARVIELSLIHI